MKRLRAAACIAACMLIVPTALAASGLVATELVAAGATRVDGDAAALYFLAQRDGFAWDASAASATLVREHATFFAADHPLRSEYLYQNAQPWQTETLDFGAVTLASAGTLPQGAMSVRAESTALRASSEGLLEIRAVRDPTLGEAPDASTDGGDTGAIVEEFRGDFLSLTFSEGVFTLTGDLTLRLYGPAYTLSTEEDALDWRTGEYETARAAAYAEGRQERHTLTLHDAVLQVRAEEPLTLLSLFATLEVDGTLKAPSAEGAVQLAHARLAPAHEGGALAYSGAARLALAPQAGSIAASAPVATIATAGAIAPQGPPLLALGAGGLLVLALLGGALVAWRRRARGDDLELALLAMEERRWDDALPRLARLARRRPHDASVLVDRALCLEQVGRLGEAARAFEAALRAAPRHAEAHFYYARTLAKMREKDAARAHLEEALERDPRLVEMARAEIVLRGI